MLAVLPSNQRSLSNDLIFGLANENNVIQKLNTYFTNEIIKSTKELGLGAYCSYDAESENTMYEIKSRRCKYSTYPTTIVPVHKVKDSKKRLVFVFQFIDGYYYIVYNKELFDTFETKIIKLNRAGINDKPTYHYYIPISHLVEMNF
jgi:hypothetical protein